MKKIVAVLLIVLLVKYTSGQVGDKKLNLIPQNPNTASLYKFTETPVSYYNGTTGISIPVYEISTGSVKLPISLNYGSGGIKVGEDASWVGLGWNLSAGGSISYSIVGSNDEYNPLTVANYMKHNIVPNVPLGRNNQIMNVIERGVCFPDKNGVMRKYGLYENSDNDYSLGSNPNGFEVLGNANREYDLYIYNFNGYSGKLINPKINYYQDDFVSLDNNNIKFTKTGAVFPNGDFKATTPDGTVYLFNNLETTASIGNPFDVTYTRYLTSITTPEGKVINFTYNPVQTLLFPTASQSLTYRVVNEDQGGYGTSHIGVFPSRTINDAPQTQALYLAQIQWDNGKILFTSGSRSDMVGGVKLNKIVVLDKNDIQIREINFTHDYFTGNSMYGDYLSGQGYFNPPPNIPNPVVPESVRQKRLKLLSVKVDNDPPYSFEYSTVDMPYKSAFARDLWDYFNGASFTNLSNPDLYSLLPKPDDIGYYDPAISLSLNSSLPFGKRYASANHMEAGSLKKIIYPTGGYSTYEYEPNKFSAPDNVTYTIQQVSKSAHDGNASWDNPQETFLIPTVDPNGNLGRISVRLSCGCSAQSGAILCAPYSPDPNAGNADYALYVLLETRASGSPTWQEVKRWDVSTGNWDPDVTYTSDYNFIQGNEYRITANYPNSCTGDGYNHRVADIQVFYYAPVSISTFFANQGGGIRVKRITDYNVDDQVAMQRELTYEGGKLLTKPVFHRLVQWTPYTKKANSILSSDPCLGCDGSGQIPLLAMPGTSMNMDERFEAGFYSQPHVPYSYGANGSLVGYDKVTLEYKGPNGNKGRTEFEYFNKPDIILTNEEASFFTDYYLNNRSNNLISALLPGIPGIKDPLNGKLKSQTEYRRDVDVYKTIQKTLYEYDVANKQTYWAFKVEYVGMSGVIALGMIIGCNLSATSPTFFACNDAVANHLYFYPVQSYNVNLLKKTEKYYDDLTESITTTDYVYNQKNQLFKEVTNDSKGNQLSKETVYIWETGVPPSPVKTEMINRNMLDYPVEQIAKNVTLSKELDKSKTTYQLWNGNSIVSPGLVETSVGGNSVEAEMTYYNYDSKGNPLQVKGRDGVVTSYVWGYQQTYPVAKIVGATYTEVLQALGQSDNNLPYLQNMNDASLETELNKIRNNLKITIPVAQVTTFLYKPLVGISQATDPNGQKQLYEYDSSNRLILIKDNDNNVIKTFEYQYRQ